MPSITKPRGKSDPKRSQPIAEEPEIIIPAIVGIQNGRQFFTAMMTGREVAQYLNLAAKQGTTDTPDFAGHSRLVQRSIDWKRVSKLIQFIVKGLPKPDGGLPDDDYALAALTVAFDPGDEYTFEILHGNYGLLRLPPGTQFFPADGQHRGAALQKTIDLMEAAGDECIPFTLYLYRGAEHLRKLFIWLNKFAKTPDASLMVALDDQSGLATLTRTVAERMPFADRFVVEGGASVGKNEKRMLFTLKGFEHACALFADKERPEKSPDLADRATAFWLEVTENMPIWQEALQSQDCSPLRTSSLALHLVSLKGIAVASVRLRSLYSDDYLNALGGLNNIDWERGAECWVKAKVIVDGRLSVSMPTINAIADVVVEACSKYWENAHGK